MHENLIFVVMQIVIQVTGEIYSCAILSYGHDGLNYKN